jgi:hypothetical protein
MKNLLILMVCLLISGTAFSQKVDIDNYRFYVEYAQLPLHKTAPEDRTFTIQTSGTADIDLGAIADEIAIRGWEYKEEGAKALIKLKANQFVRGSSNMKKEEHVKKNKEGKVTSRKYTYVVSSSNIGKASLSVYGPSNPYKKKDSKKEKERKDKKKKKNNKKKEEAKAKKAANPFLKGVEISTDDEATEEGDKKPSAVRDLSLSYSVASASMSSSKAAYNDYNNKSGSSYTNQRSKYFESLASRASTSLNAVYGYARKRDYVKFKRLDSKKHPEFEMFDAATVAMKEILGKKRFNKTHDEIEAAMAPIIEYFNSVKDKYSQDKKHPKRLKAAAMYNLAQIYLYLDQPEKTMEIGNEYIRWDHDKKDGKRFVESGESLQHYLAFHGSKRYFVTNEDADKITSEDQEVSSN